MKSTMLRFLSTLLCTCIIAAGIPCITETGTNSVSAAESYEQLFENDHIMKVEIQISDEDWQSMLENPTLEEYHSATVTVDGETVENVGIRTKGNSSLSSVANSDSDRYSFRIKFDKYVKKQNLLGLDEMVVNSQFSDPSYLREFLSYEALREIGSPAPLSTFAEIYINGELFGFYLAAESMDDSLLERNFGDDNGNLYKAGMGSSLVYQENSTYDSLELKKGDDTEKTGLKSLIQTLNEMPDGEKGAIESVLDVDSALQYIAANTVLGNYDSYNGSMLQNYYLYEQDGKFTVIPWDYNMSFGGYMGSAQSARTIPIDEPVFGVSMEKTPMITNLLEVPEYKETYYGYIQDLLEYLDGFEDRVAELTELIRPYVEADPTKFVTMEEFESAVTYQENESLDNGFGGQMPSDQGAAGQLPDGQQMTPPNGEFSGQPGEMPQDMTPPDFSGGQPSENGNGQWPGRPDGGNFTPPDGENQGERPNGGHGGDMMMKGTGGSIINYVRARVENIEQQLSGALPTTGNTTMNQGGPGGFQPGNRDPQQPIKVLLNGTQVTFDQQPVIQDSRTLVPIRAIFEALDITLDWDEATQTVTATKGSDTLTLVIGQQSAEKNGKTLSLEVPAQIIGNRTYVPLRFLSESFNLSVGWEEATRTATITS